MRLSECVVKITQTSHFDRFSPLFQEGYKTWTKHDMCKACK